MKNKQSNTLVNFLVLVLYTCVVVAITNAVTTSDINEAMNAARREVQKMKVAK